MKYTPGSWHIDGRPGYEALEIHSGNRRIAKLLYHGGSEDNEADANAHLIAAAPDLLEALRWLVNLHSGVSKAGIQWRSAEEWESAIEVSKVAIAKAEGREP